MGNQKQKQIADSHNRLLKRQATLTAALQALQEECKHPNAEKKYGSNTGNYDPSADCYWTDFRCHDCGKVWTVDGTVR